MSNLRADLLPILRCPHTRAALVLCDGQLVSPDGYCYPIVSGKPVLVRRPEAINVTPPGEDKVSRTTERFELPGTLEGARIRGLHLGSGNVPCTDPRVISVDVLPNEHVDVVAEAEALPFADASFDYVESGATFEHVYDPLQSIAEVRRVLRPGGLVRIDTAFMQSYHGFPGHYFNMTPLAVDTFLLDDFELLESGVPDSATPLEAIASLLNRFLGYMTETRRREISSWSVSRLLEAMTRDPGHSARLLSEQSEFALRAMGASYALLARKPADYESRSGALKRSLGEDWPRLKRRYHAVRSELLLRHHEVDLYRRWSQERAPGEGTDIPDVAPAADWLARTRVADPLSPSAYRAAIESAEACESELRSVRDRWIYIFLASKSSANTE
jgi:SAM-dependent methyltransferase/uncharacterized protein YbaR (Trm112 family)